MSAEVLRLHPAWFRYTMQADSGGRSDVTDRNGSATLSAPTSQVRIRPPAAMRYQQPQVLVAGGKGGLGRLNDLHAQPAQLAGGALHVPAWPG